ncbi:MAG: ribonuclease III [Prevotellaceae bacterium]|nr:ribonuclease III [Prevotellaceae bacterium]
MISLIKSIIVNYSEDKQLYKSLKKILGKYPNNINLYKVALTQRSDIIYNKKKAARTNERLEYLGDAIVGSIVAEYLFTQFPNKQEGFLTKMRAKIVSRKSLNTLSQQTGLMKLLTQHRTHNKQAKGAAGNIFEAIHGAMLLDFGYETTKKIFIKQFLKLVDISKLTEEEVDYKSKILEWGQKNKSRLTFECYEESNIPSSNRFRAILFDGDVILGEGYGGSKKEAEQSASKQVMFSGKIDINVISI